jgi:hypothetical protein
VTVFAFVASVGPITIYTTSRMSFADIRAERQAKEAKSLVVSSRSSGSKPSSANTAKAPSEPLFGTLPSSIDIQSSPERGRSIYAKESFKKGEVERHLPRLILISVRRWNHSQRQAIHLCPLYQKLGAFLFVLCLSCSGYRSQALHTM